MSVLVLLELAVKPDRLDDMRSDMTAALPDTRAFAGCEEVRAHQNQDDPSTFVIVERWASRADYEKYLAWREERGDLDNLRTMLSGPPSIRYFDDIGA
jgi:quinol monooxygenase YgiN